MSIQKDLTLKTITMANITIVKNATGTFTIDVLATLKTTYPLTATVFVDGTSVTTGVITAILPFTTSLSTGVHEIKVTMNSASASLTDSICYMNDTTLYCAVLKRLAALSEKKRNIDQTLALNYMLTKGLENASCACGCDNLKTIYTDLKDIVDPTSCPNC